MTDVQGRRVPFAPAGGRALRADVVNARVWLGIHFRFADVAARNLGIHLAEWTLHHYFQPVKPRG